MAYIYHMAYGMGMVSYGYVISCVCLSSLKTVQTWPQTKRAVAVLGFTAQHKPKLGHGEQTEF